MIYSKTLDLNDYSWLEPQVKHILKVKNTLESKDAIARFEHEHRAWEYAIVIKALSDCGISKVLDVGGGASIFAPAYTIYPHVESVFQVDDGVEMAWIPKQESTLGISLPYSNTNFFAYEDQQSYGAVVSISVLEHIPEDLAFFKRMLKCVAPGGLIAMTVDFHPSGRKLVYGHIRTYSEESLMPFILAADIEGFDFLGDGYDYTDRGNNVNDYNFASLIMRKETHGKSPTGNKY